MDTRRASPPLFFCFGSTELEEELRLRFDLPEEGTGTADELEFSDGALGVSLEESGAGVREAEGRFSLFFFFFASGCCSCLGSKGYYKGKNDMYDPFQIMVHANYIMRECAVCTFAVYIVQVSGP